MRDLNADSAGPENVEFRLIVGIRKLNAKRRLVST